MLTKEAFNALLKTIEEPPPGVIFVLATTEEHKVPPTILSRCQRLMFRLANSQDLVEHLLAVAKKENIEIESDALELVARRSGGGLRDALGLLDQASLLARPGEPVTQKDLLVLLGALDEDVLLSLSKGIIERNGKGVIDDISGLIMQGREPALIAQELAKHFLNLTKASYVTESERNAGANLGQFILGSQTYIQGLIEQTKSFERAELSQMVEHLDGLEQALKRTSQPSMTLEMALLSLCHRNEIANVKELEKRLAQLEKAVSEGDFGSHAGGHRMAARDDSHRPHQQTVQQPAARPAPPPVQQPAPQMVAQSAPGPVPQPAAQPVPQPTQAVESAPPTVQESAPAEPAQPLADAYGDDDDQLPMFQEDGSEEEEDAYLPPVRSDAVAQSPPPPPVPQPAAAQPYEAQSADEMPLTELDELWSALLDALHKRSIPAYSLVQAHAFPIRLEPGQLTIGVKQVFQKSIEGKVNQIATAFKDVRNEDIRVMVKVADGNQPSEKSKRPAASNAGLASAGPPPQENNLQPASATATSTATMETGTNRSSYTPPAGSGDQDDDGADDEEPQPAGYSAPSQSRHDQQHAPAGTAPAAEERARTAGTATATQTETGAPSPSAKGHSEVKTRIDSVILVEDSGLESSSLQETYKIFEGPGSRLIG